MGWATQNEARLGNGSYGTLVGNEAKTGYGSGLNDWGHTLAVELKYFQAGLKLGLDFQLPPPVRVKPEWPRGWRYKM